MARKNGITGPVPNSGRKRTSAGKSTYSLTKDAYEIIASEKNKSAFISEAIVWYSKLNNSENGKG